MMMQDVFKHMGNVLYTHYMFLFSTELQNVLLYSKYTIIWWHYWAGKHALTGHFIRSLPKILQELDDNSYQILPDLATELLLSGGCIFFNKSFKMSFLNCKDTIICVPQKGYQVISSWTSNACQFFRQVHTQALDIFSGKIVKQDRARNAELSIGADQCVPPAELSCLSVKDFTDQVWRGTLGKTDCWTWPAREGREINSRY